MIPAGNVQLHNCTCEDHLQVKMKPISLENRIKIQVCGIMRGGKYDGVFENQER